MSIVYLDTQILYWALVKKPPVGQEYLVSRAADFLRWLEQNKADIIIPSIVVGEMLVPVEEKSVSTVQGLFRRDWLVVDYDLNAALVFSRLRRDHIIQKRFKEFKKLGPHVTRRELVADVMIIATAIAHRADKLYTHDQKMLDLAEGIIDVENFEDVPIQLSYLNAPATEEGESPEENPDEELFNDE